MTVYVTPYDVESKKCIARSQPVKKGDFASVSKATGLEIIKKYKRMWLSKPDLAGTALAITDFILRVEK